MKFTIKQEGKVLTNEVLLPFHLKLTVEVCKSRKERLKIET